MFGFKALICANPVDESKSKSTKLKLEAMKLASAAEIGE
jgi:hypothetical protein